MHMYPYTVRSLLLNLEQNCERGFAPVPRKELMEGGAELLLK